MEFDKQGILNREKAAQQTAAVMDEGLRAYMLKVYNYMATGVLLTGIIALLSFKMSVVTDANGSIVSLTQFGSAIYMSGLKMDCNVSAISNSFLYEFWN
jgi:FtsH-binding integral membrane protein